MMIAAACTGSHRDAEQPRPPGPLVLYAAGATEAAIRDEMPAFQTRSGMTVTMAFAAAGAVRDQVSGGTAIDVAITTPAAFAMIDPKLLRLSSRFDIGQVGGGFAVKAGMSPPAITTDDEFKQALIDADEVYYADPAVATAGQQLMKVVDALGIGDQVRAKGKTAPGGKEAMRAMARSTAARPVGVTQISEIMSVPEVMLVGPYPADLQVKTVYSAMIVASSARADDAEKLVQFFASAEFQARLARSGFEQVPVAPR
jgi:molybdate transport system substrate-binding protein